MGYRSNVGIATTKEVYDRLMKEATEDTKYLLKICNEYYTTKYQPTIYDKENVDFIPNGPEETIVILRWHWIKRYAADYAFIEKFIIENEGCIAWVGEEFEDVGYECYGESDIPWYDYIEVRSDIVSDLPDESCTKNYTEFLERLKKCN